MDKQSNYYEYDELEQAKMARDIIKEVIVQNGKVLKQKHYYKYLKLFYDLLSKDLPEENDYFE